MIEKFDISAWFFERLFRYRNKCSILVFNYVIHLVSYIKGVKIGKKVVFNGFPRIRRNENSKILIGDNCTFNSAKNSEIIIGNNTGGSGITLLAAIKIKIGNNVMIGAHSMIIDTDFHHTNPNKRHDNIDIPARPVIIEDNVFIGTNCMILKGITLGEN